MKKNWKRRILSLLMTFVMAVPLVAGAAGSIPNICTIIQSGKIYRFKNVSTGAYLSVALHQDSNDVNIIQKDYDGTLSQQFRVVYDTAEDRYRIYPMVSSSGNGRMITAVAPLGPSSYSNVVMRAASTAAENYQTWRFENRSTYDRNHVQIISGAGALYANSGNGAQSGTGADSVGNVYLKNSSEGNEGKWVPELVNGSDVIETGVYSIRNANGKYLEVSGRASIKLADAPNGINTQWQVLYLGNGMYQFRPQYKTETILVLPRMSEPSLTLKVNGESDHFYIIPYGDRYIISSAHAERMDALCIIGNAFTANGYINPSGLSEWEFIPA